MKRERKYQITLADSSRLVTYAASREEAARWAAEYLRAHGLPSVAVRRVTAAR